MDFPLEEYLSIARDLEKHSMLFNRLWEAGRPVFVADIPTSAVRLNKENDVLEFVLNEKFWNSLDDYSKRFVISHECAHIALKHGSRGAALEKKYTHEAQNIAMDISINHLLCKYFDFERGQISCGQTLCWIDTVFPPEQKVLEDKAFEYYLEQMKSLPSGEGGIPMFAGEGVPLDDPSASTDNGITKWLEEQVANIGIGISQEDLDEAEHKLAGKESSLNTWLTINTKPIPKKKWMTLIKNWNKKTLDEDEAGQWTKTNRRYASLPSEFFLPTDNSEDNFGKHKVRIYLFLDVSGSCFAARERFLIAAQSIPPKFFDIKTFAFDDRAIEIDLKENRIPLGSGTNFNSIEQTLLKLKEYPEVVWVFTDGEDKLTSAKHPERWSWFLLPNGRRTGIPKKSKIYMLDTFE